MHEGHWQRERFPLRTLPSVLQAQQERHMQMYGVHY